jgi:acyl carrier protein phosphodiesterase
MNFLAHFHLSGENELIATGNFLGDFIRGNELTLLPLAVQKGVYLHRFIDQFTDNHPVVREVNKILVPYFAKYAPVVSDIYFDYFLASNFSAYSDISLRDYTHSVYDIMERNKQFFTDRAARFYHFMMERDIFFEYGNKGGLQHVFNGLSSRASFVSKMENGVTILTQHENQMRKMFEEFYPDLQKASSTYLLELTDN